MTLACVYWGFWVELSCDSWVIILVTGYGDICGVNVVETVAFTGTGTIIGAGT